MLSNIIVIACPTYDKSRGRVVFVNRRSLKIMQEYIGDQEGAELGQELTKIESQDGVQSYVFFT